MRYSSPLFRLATAEEIHTRVMFHNTGPDQQPGIIAMTISDGRCAGPALDPNYDGLLVIFNAHIEPQTFETGLSGMRLHSLLANGTDQVVKTAAITDGGTVSLPPLTAAVFVKPQGRTQGEFVCNP